MRLATYVPDGALDTECVATVLTGEAGGVFPNLNRWRGQLGLPALTDEESAALVLLDLLGSQAVYMECTGAPVGPASTSGDYMLLGLVCPLPAYTVFVKMTGPAEEISEEKEHFMAFVKSLHFEESAV